MRIFNFISYVVVGLIQIANGFLILEITPIYKHIYQRGMPGKPLPAVTDWLLNYSDSVTPIWVAFAIGIGLIGLLFFLDRSDEMRRVYFPACIVAAIAFSWLQLVAIFAALSMPFVPLIA